MMTPRRSPSVRRIGTALLLAAACACRPATAEEAPVASPWNLSFAGGLIDFEGDEPVKDAALYTLRLGRALDDRWTVEGAFALVPALDETTHVPWRVGARTSRLEEAAGTGVNDTWSMRLTVELLRHLAPRARIAPFLAAGGGMAWYADGMPDDVEPLLQAGGGLLAHLNDQWAVRADARVVLAGRDSEFNGTYLVGLQWSPGHTVAPRLPATALPVEMPTADAVEAVDENLQVYVLRLGFDPGDWKIKSEYYSEIGVIAKALQDHPGSTARIDGHVDSLTVKGTAAGQRLSKRRAEAVRDALVEDWGIARNRLTPAGFGASRPATPEESAPGSPANERIEVTIKRPAH